LVWSNPGCFRSRSFPFLLPHAPAPTHVPRTHTALRTAQQRQRDTHTDTPHHTHTHTTHAHTCAYNGRAGENEGGGRGVPARYVIVMSSAAAPRRAASGDSAARRLPSAAYCAHERAQVNQPMTTPTHAEREERAPIRADGDSDGGGQQQRQPRPSRRDGGTRKVFFLHRCFCLILQRSLPRLRHE